MTDSIGKTPRPEREQVTLVAVEPVRPAATPEKKTYRKPALKRLGLLRSVTGSTLKW